MLPLTIFYFIISGYILHMCIGKFFNPDAACYRLVSGILMCGCRLTPKQQKRLDALPSGRF